MTPAATSGVDGVLGGRELEPGAALYLCGPAIAQQKRHRPECGHRLEALGATDYVRIRWYGRAKQQRLAYGARRPTAARLFSTAPAHRKLRVGWQKGGRYHRYHKDIMSMMSAHRMCLPSFIKPQSLLHTFGSKPILLVHIRVLFLIPQSEYLQ